MLFFCVVVGDGLSGGRAALGQACGQGDCMFVSGAVVSPGHTMCLWLLPCRAPHNSPGTLMRAWLRQMGFTLRLVAAECLTARSRRH